MLATFVLRVDWLCVLTTACTKCLQAKLRHTGRHGKDKKNVWNRSVHPCFHRVFVVSKVPLTNEVIIRHCFFNLYMVRYMTLTHFNFEFASWWLTSWKQLCSLYCWVHVHIPTLLHRPKHTPIISHHENSYPAPPENIDHNPENIIFCCHSLLSTPSKEPTKKTTTSMSWLVASWLVVDFLSFDQPTTGLRCAKKGWLLWPSSWFLGLGSCLVCFLMALDPLPHQLIAHDCPDAPFPRWGGWTSLKCLLFNKTCYHGRRDAKGCLLQSLRWKVDKESTLLLKPGVLTDSFIVIRSYGHRVIRMIQ